MRAWRAAIVLVAGIAAPCFGDPPATVADWARAYDQAALFGPGVDAAGRRLAHGHLEIHLSSGRLFPVRVGGTLAGVFFMGRGSFRYVSTDPAEAPVYRRNADKSSDYVVAADGSLGDAVEEALIVSSAAEALVQGTTWTEGPSPKDASQRFAAHVDRRRHDLVPPYRQLMSQARLDPPAEPLVIVEIKADRHDVSYQSDTLRDHVESLAVVGKYGEAYAFLRPSRRASILSRQPVGRARLVPPPVPYVLRALDVEVVNAKDQEARVVAREKVEARAPRRTLAFDLANWMIGNPNATSSRALIPYRLVGVTGADAAPLPFVHQGNDLVVELPRALGVGETVDLTFTMSGDVLHRPEGDTYWGLLQDWFPSAPHAPMNAFTYHAVVKAADGFIPFSSGATVRRWKEGALTCAEFRDPSPMGYAEVLAGRYITHSDARGRLTVRVSSYALAKGDAAKQIAGLVHAFVAFYEPLLGPFPWPELDVIEINSYGFGHAPPGMIFITKEAFNPLADPVGNEFAVGINRRLAHEVAHAWFGHVAKHGEREDQWLSESTAEYFSALAMQLKDPKELGWALDGWKDRSKGVTDLPVYLANQLSGDDAFWMRVRLLYAKGPLVLHALRRELGDQTFFTVHKSLMRSFPMKPVHTRDFIGLTSFVAKKDYRAWFDRYLLGAEMPPGGK